LKALVLPENAPDGSPLASGYSWTGGSKLTFVSPTAQTTKLEPASADPSTAKDDQDVDVAVMLPGGKVANGFARFSFAAGGMDEKHKMTVFVVEIDKCPMAFLPQGGAADNMVNITSRVRPSELKGRFIFTLEEVSHENGFCSNAPTSLPIFPWAEDGSLFRDLQFEDQAGYNIDGILWNYRAKTDDEDLSEATVEVMSYDYGAFGQIKAEFEHEGTKYLARETGGTKLFTNIPFDDDANDIADMWTGNAGNANDDTDNNPAPGTVGDGLSRYEEYRGFLVNTTHTRTNPDNKDVFIYDEDGMGLGLFGTLGLTNHVIVPAEFNGTAKREINFRRESHSVVLQHGLWLRDHDLGGMGSWGSAEAVGPPGDPGRTHVNVDVAQINADMTNTTPVGYPPAGAANRSATVLSQIIAHELGHSVAVFHHGTPGDPALPVSGGDTACVMRYYYRDMRAATAMPAPGNIAAFAAVNIGTTFRNTAPDVCQSDVDVSD
jgi:hypothetical protein